MKRESVSDVNTFDNPEMTVSNIPAIHRNDYKIGVREQFPLMFETITL
jgi:hypothetical protein